MNNNQESGGGDNNNNDENDDENQLRNKLQQFIALMKINNEYFFLKINLGINT